MNLMLLITRLKEKTAEFEKRGMRLFQIRSVGEPLRLGRLQGNHFDLVVRDLRPHGASDAHSSGADTHTRLAALVHEALENVKVYSKSLQLLSHICRQRDVRSQQCVLAHACFYGDTEKINKYCPNIDTHKV